MDESIRRLIFQAMDQAISKEDFERLQDVLEQSEELRAEYLRALTLSESLHEIAAEDTSGGEPIDPKPADSWRNQLGSKGPFPPANHEEVRYWAVRSPRLWALAASILAIVSGTAFWLGHRNGIRRPAQVAPGESLLKAAKESLIAGHATLRRSVDLQWADKATTYREGDVLPQGRLKFEAGVAEIDFFCGATLIVEGPATLEVESDWSVRMDRGRLRANVPPAARGFVVKASGSEIVDLGTEFALEVGAKNARVEVLDGEVKLRGGEHDGQHLITGQQQWLRSTQAEQTAIQGLSTVGDVRRRRKLAESQRLARWKEHSQQLRADERLIVYYPIAEVQEQRLVPNAAASGSELDGRLVGPVHRTTGRFGAESAGLEFDRLGARVRTRIDGSFQAFTFMCWVRIDSLDHVYSALFMGDGYENGEPHWQIRDDGRLMFSVMVDDTQDIRVANRFDQRMVQDAGLHRVYFTEPFWDISKSGQWFHIAAVYDPMGRRVRQYVDGRLLSEEEIVDKFHITKLRIGPAEIGNWGQPFRKSPWFAVRNLNGIIDELAIFDAALTSEEVRTLYEQGKPLGY